MNHHLKLENQLCFTLYSLSKLITNQYRPYLEPLDLTYPQYLVMLVLWEHQEISVSGIGHQLQLDSGTLTPLLKRLESKTLVVRTRSKTDERTVIISLTPQGQQLQKQAVNIPHQIQSCLKIHPDELATLKHITEKIFHHSLEHSDTP